MISKLIGIFGFLVIASSAQKIPVAVFYETLCPDSQAFITEQLYPTLKTKLGQLVDLKLIPFGKSNYSTLGADVQFTCHHGPNECYGNKVQSCAIEHIQVNSYQNQFTKETLTLEYINCLMKAGNNFPDSIYPGKKCARDINLNNWENIEQCANSTEGSKLLQANGELTAALNPPLTSVPTITFRHQFERELQPLALTNFRVALCRKLPQPLPIECSNIPNGAEQSILSSMFVVITMFVLSKMF